MKKENHLLQNTFAVHFQDSGKWANQETVLRILFALMDAELEHGKEVEDALS